MTYEYNRKIDREFREMLRDVRRAEASEERWKRHVGLEGDRIFALDVHIRYINPTDFHCPSEALGSSLNEESSIHYPIHHGEMSENAPNPNCDLAREFKLILGYATTDVI